MSWTWVISDSCSANQCFQRAISAMVSRKSCQTEQVQLAAVMPPRAMSSKTSRENLAITRPSMWIASSCWVMDSSGLPALRPVRLRAHHST